jgi:hypothetical protein
VALCASDFFVETPDRKVAFDAFVQNSTKLKMIPVITAAGMGGSRRV